MNKVRGAPKTTGRAFDARQTYPRKTEGICWVDIVGASGKAKELEMFRAGSEDRFGLEASGKPQKPAIVRGIGRAIPESAFPR